MTTMKPTLTAAPAPGGKGAMARADDDLATRRAAITELAGIGAAFLVGFVGVPHVVTWAAGSHRLSASILGAILGDLLEVTAVIALLRRTRSHPLDSVRLRLPSLSHVGAAAGIAVALTVVNAVGTGMLHAGNSGLVHIGQLSVPERIALVVTVAVAEELIYRGVLLTRVYELTGSAQLAVAISTVCFAVAHVSFFGIGYLIVVAIPALALGVLLVVTDDLTECIVVHLLIDLPLLLIH